RRASRPARSPGARGLPAPGRSPRAARLRGRPARSDSLREPAMAAPRGASGWKASGIGERPVAEQSGEADDREGREGVDRRDEARPHSVPAPGDGRREDREPDERADADA